MRRFMPLLLKARHEERKDLGDQELLKALATEAGLDIERFTKDLNDRSTLDDIAASHKEAVEERGVFGTPTFVFENGASAFLKLIRPKTPEQAEKAFDSLVNIMSSDIFVGEVKRPQPPWPKGVFD
jgi:protein-disulfide isomerase